ncbi:WbuC family cupin fold metalloprotein [Stigmatella sp. ncwal1]|uniref:WbuC family cupin fold metalloprotein n=1 Tax=Stigmatella ashevillensis TaxID=2995309 RepID=A0ABT5DA16_9BACT|nr:WbuC family cupin fold metalloprotein [Stigmatella ashevillena]MDC0709638.1 WbuC family cupin fold metalloprotein [Stigmatella ashevillena]
MSASSRRALDAPDGELVVLSRSLVDDVTEASRANPRRRIILPFHKGEAELLHRMLNVIQPDSYVRPHRHLDPPKAEAWVVLRGTVAFFTFEEDGRVRDCLSLDAVGEHFGVDLAPGIFHGLIALAPDRVLMLRPTTSPSPLGYLRRGLQRPQSTCFSCAPNSGGATRSARYTASPWLRATSFAQ